MNASNAGSKGALLPAVVTFVLVTGAILVAGNIATWLLRQVVLPIVAVILGFVAARVVYKLRD